ncbi:MAG: lysophospholipase [Trueperaceae bacterium]|nr:lysophospholipase [Trueperaceae bacterium]
MTASAAATTLEVRDGLSLSLSRWRPEASVGALVIVHGYGEHATRHLELARSAQEVGYDVFAPDLRGHGKSPGVRGGVPGFEGIIADLTAVFAQARAANPGLPTLLFGHSMGGAIALRYALERPAEVNALALSSPFLRDAVARPAWLLAVSGVLGKVLPNLPTVKLDPALISRHPAEVERYRADPLIYHGGVRANAGATLTTQGAELLALAPGLAVPTLVVVGTADGIADPAGARALAAASDRVRLEELPGGFHELHHDDPGTGVPQKFKRLLVEWLEANARRA